MKCPTKKFCTLACALQFVFGVSNLDIGLSSPSFKCKSTCSVSKNKQLVVIVVSSFSQRLLCTAWQSVAPQTLTLLGHAVLVPLVVVCPCLHYFSGMVVQTVVEGTGASPLPTDTVKASPTLSVPYRTVPSWVIFVSGPSRLVD